MKWRVLLVVGCFALILTGGYLLRLLIGPTSRINQSTIRKVEFGMNQAEVEAIFRVPAGDYSGRDSEKRIIGMRKGRDVPRGHIQKIWVGHESGIALSFDERGVVSREAGISLYIGLGELSWEEKIHKWLGLSED